jgi:hypothetical protein
MDGRTRIPDILLERYAARDLPERESARVAAAVASDPEVASRVAAIEASNTDLLSKYPAAVMAQRISVRAWEKERSKRTLSPAWFALPAAAAVAVLLVVLQPGTREPGSTGPAPSGTETPAGTKTETVRLKGDPQLLLFRLEGTRGVPLEDGAQARAGDRIQVGYRAAGAVHGVILSVDGRGVATLHFPASPGAPTFLSQAQAVTLPRSYQLDDAPRFERFHFITSTARLDVNALVDAAGAAGGDTAEALELPPGAKDATLLLIKETLEVQP